MQNVFWGDWIDVSDETEGLCMATHVMMFWKEMLCFHFYSLEQMHLKSIIKQMVHSIIEVLCTFVFRLAVQEVKVLWGMNKAR